MTDQFDAVRQTLDVLRRYYADRDGRPHRLNETQIAVYLDGLGSFDSTELEAAARAHMRGSAFFPKLSELLALLQSAVDWHAASHLAWAAVERGIRRGGRYRGVEFANGAIGEAVRQTFGSWADACGFESDSPGWAIRRQTFLAIFPSIATQHDGSPVVCRGEFQNEQPYQVGPVNGLPIGVRAPTQSLTKGEASQALADIRQRAIAAGKVQP